MKSFQLPQYFAEFNSKQIFTFSLNLFFTGTKRYARQKEQNNFASYNLAFLSPIPTLCKTMAFTATKLLTIKVEPKLFFLLSYSFPFLSRHASVNLSLRSGIKNFERFFKYPHARTSLNLDGILNPISFYIWKTPSHCSTIDLNKIVSTGTFFTSLHSYLIVTISICKKNISYDKNGFYQNNQLGLSVRKCAEIGQKWDFRALFSEIYMKIELLST